MKNNFKTSVIFICLTILCRELQKEYFSFKLSRKQIQKADKVQYQQIKMH